MRGQYTRGGTREELMPGYREEPGVDPLSWTETFVAMRLGIENWRWAGVPVYVRTGKRLRGWLTEGRQEVPPLPRSARSSASKDGPNGGHNWVNPLREAVRRRYGSLRNGALAAVSRCRADSVLAQDIGMRCLKTSA